MSSIGVSLSNEAKIIANVTANPNLVTGLSLKFGCVGCSSNSIGNPIVGFNGNGSISAASLPVPSASAGLSGGARPAPATLIAHNATTLAHFTSNYTPTGFVTINTTVQHLLTNSSAVRVTWVAQGNSTRSPLSSGAVGQLINSASSNSTPLAVKAAAPYLKAFLNGTSAVNETTTQKIYITDTVNGNSVAVRYVPSNQTTYRGNQSAVVSVTNLVSGFNDTLNVKGSSLPFDNITFSTRQNFTTYVLGVRAYAANTTNLTLSGKQVPKPPGLPISYISISSTANDSSINAVNYTFNVSRSYLLRNNLTSNTLALYRFNATTSTWAKLVTTLIGSNSTNYFYDARSPGMSLYAVSGISNAVIGNLTHILNPTTIASQTNATSPVSSSSSGFQIPTTAWVVGVIVVVIIAAVGISFRRFVKPEEPPQPPIYSNPPPPPVNLG